MLEFLQRTAHTRTINQSEIKKKGLDPQRTRGKRRLLLFSFLNGKKGEGKEEKNERRKRKSPNEKN